MNPRLPATHLSEEAIHDHLIGIATPEAEEHLSVCPSCRSRIASFRADLTLFRQATLAWARERSEENPIAFQTTRSERVPTSSLPTSRESVDSKSVDWKPTDWKFAGWRSITGAAAALLFAAALWGHQHAPSLLTLASPSTASPAQASRSVTASAGSQDPDPGQIAQDNQLLRNVYNALEDQPQSPVSEFSLTALSPAESSGPSQPPTKARTQ